MQRLILVSFVLVYLVIGCIFTRRTVGGLGVGFRRCHNPAVALLEIWVAISWPWFVVSYGLLELEERSR
jgi:hypothetical protein